MRHPGHGVHGATVSTETGMERQHFLKGRASKVNRDLVGSTDNAMTKRGWGGPRGPRTLNHRTTQPRASKASTFGVYEAEKPRRNPVAKYGARETPNGVRKVHVRALIVVQQ